MYFFGGDKWKFTTTFLHSDQGGAKRVYDISLNFQKGDEIKK